MRLDWADAYKGFLIALVVLGHSIQYSLGDINAEENYLWRIIYSFHMPCFIMISGMFATKMIDSCKAFVLSLRRRFFQLMIPMLCWQVLYNFTPPILTNIEPILFIDCGVYWFLWALFFINVIYLTVLYSASRLNIKEWYLHLLIIGALFGIMLVFDYREHGMQYISFYYPFYILGFYYHHSFAINKLSKISLLLFLVVWFVCSLFWDMHKAPVFLHGISLIPEALLCYGYRYFVALIAFLAFYGIMMQGFKILPKRIKILLLNLGTNSLGIYTTHILLLKPLRAYLPQLVSEYGTFVVILFVWCIGVILSYYIVLLLLKGKLTSKVLFGKIRK